jgi:hypothetical protein
LHEVFIMRTRLTLAAVIAAAVVLIAADEPNFSTWDSNGGGADHSQYSSLKQINKNNVKQLQVAWMYESGNNPTFNPVVVDGTMYVGLRTPSSLWTRPLERKSGSIRVAERLAASTTGKVRIARIVVCCSPMPARSLQSTPPLAIPSCRSAITAAPT